MEFGEKLQTLRKQRGLTQEELAQALYVSRTAISKWESGRGYPSIDSLKEISRFFSVSIDELLSGEKLICLAEKENKASIQRLCNLLLGIVDLFAVTLILLPLYPKVSDGFIYSVNLLSYPEAAFFPASMYWMLFPGLMALGIIKLVLTQLPVGKGQTLVTALSFGLSIVTVLLLSITREAYAIVMVVGTLIEHTAGIITSGSRFPCKTGQRLSAIGAKESTEEKVLIIGTRWSIVRGLRDLLLVDSLYLLK